MSKKEFEEKWVGIAGLPTSVKEISLYGLDIDKLWTWIEQEIKQAEEKGYNKGFGVGYERAILRYGTINQT